MTFTTEEKSILHQRRSHESIGHNANTSIVHPKLKN